MKPVRQLILREECFQADRHVARLIAKIVDPDARDFDFERVSARGLSPDALAGRLLTSPMMAEFRTLVVDDFEAYFRSGSSKDDTTESDSEVDSGSRRNLSSLSVALGRSDVPAHVIFIAAKVDKRTAFYKSFLKNGEVVEFKKPYDNQVPGLLMQEARAMGLQLESGVAELLAATAGSELMLLVNELEKLSVYAHPDKVITRRHVEAAVGTGPVDNIFALGNFLGERNFYAAGKLFRRMTEEGEPLIMIIGMVIAHFRKLLLTREAQSGASSGVPLAQLLKTSPYFVKDYETQAKRFSLAELKTLYTHLMTLSEDIRHSAVDKTLLFENFLRSACLKASPSQ